MITSKTRYNRKSDRKQNINLTASSRFTITYATSTMMYDMNFRKVTSMKVLINLLGLPSGKETRYPFEIRETDKKKGTRNGSTGEMMLLLIESVIIMAIISKIRKNTKLLIDNFFLDVICYFFL